MSGAGSAQVYGPVYSYLPLNGAGWGTSVPSVATWNHPSWSDIVGFLGESGKKEAVEVLFGLIHKFRHGMNLEQIESLAKALFDLYPKHHLIINKNLDDLIAVDDVDLRKIGKKIREMISWKRIEK